MGWPPPDGTSYRPSNGTAGQSFIEAWCGCCKNDAHGDCPIIARSMAFGVDEPEYPTEWVWKDGQPVCTAFDDRRERITNEERAAQAGLFPSGGGRVLTIDKKLLCEAFCGDLAVTEVPAGFAVRTAFYTRYGDAIGFYITRDSYDQRRWRLEDSGLLVPELEASGIDLERGARADAFKRLLVEYEADYDDATFEIRSQYIDESELPSQAMRFIALLIRVRDMELLAPEQVESTFKDDVENALREKFEGKATIEFRVPPAPGYAEWVADCVLTYSNASLAIFVGTHEARVDEALLVWYENKFVRRGNLRVALMLESAKPPQITNRVLARAINRLDQSVVFRGDEMAAMTRIANTLGIPEAQWLH